MQKQNLLSFFFTFPKLPTNPLIFWLEELPVGESLEKEVESCLLRVLALPPGMDSSVGGEELPLVFT